MDAIQIKSRGIFFMFQKLAWRHTQRGDLKRLRTFFVGSFAWNNSDPTGHILVTYYIGNTC